MSSELRAGLLREISAEEVETFWRDGVVCLRDVVDPAWLETLVEPIDRLLGSGQVLDLFAPIRQARLERGTDQPLHDQFLVDEMPGEFAEGAGFAHLRDAARADEAIGRFASDSMLPEIAGQVLRASSVNLYLDQLLVKEPGTPTRTAFHVDEPYFNVVGDQVCTCWVPLDVVTMDSGAMGYVRGSHLWTDDFLPNNFITGALHEAAKGVDAGERVFLEVDRHPEDFDIIYYECGPGDVSIHHYRTVHGSGGNTTRDRRRRALAIRYCGDDVRYQHKPTAPSDNSDGLLQDGQRLGEVSIFPQCWTRS